MTSTAGTGTEIADVVDAPTGDAASGMGGASPVLSLTGISKRFGPVQANDDITIECLAGEIHALLGENGSGKSTLLSVASGILAPDSGTVEIAGERLAVGVAAGRDAARAGHGVSAPHRRRRPDRGGEPLPRCPRPRPARLFATCTSGRPRRSISTSSTSPPPPESRASPPPSSRCSRSCRRCSRSRRCCCSTSRPPRSATATSSACMR